MLDMHDVSEAGATAARDGQRRSANPHSPDSEAWSVWMDAFDTQTVRQQLAGTEERIPFTEGNDGREHQGVVTSEIVYRSPNGDDWLLERDPSGVVVAIVHKANQSSGGTRTRMPVDEFLERGGGGPEVAAVRAAIGR